MATPTSLKNQVISMVEFFEKKPGHKRTFFVAGSDINAADFVEFIVVIYGISEYLRYVKSDKTGIPELNNIIKKGIKNVCYWLYSRIFK